MQFPRLPEWLTYGAVVIAIALAALGRRENADAPPAPPPLSKDEGALLSPASTFDHTIVVKTGGGAFQPVTATAFSVGDGGVWLTARHVVTGCHRIAVMETSGRGAEALLVPSKTSTTATDVAVLKTQGGAPAIPLFAINALRVGERGFHPGFPAGAPGEATSRLLGRQTLVETARGRSARASGARAEPVLAWAETGRTEGVGGNLAGLSGAPVLNTRGEVVGVTLAQAARRGRIYSSTPEAMYEALRQAHALLPQAVTGDAVTIENYGRVADTLRRDLRVAQVVCM